MTADARDIWFLGGLLRLRATAEETGGAYTLVEERLPAGYAAPMHVHAREEEAFLVLEGEITFWIAEERRVLGAGDYLNLAREVPHGFRVTSPGPTHAIMVAAPAGLEGFFRAAGDPAAEPAIPPPADGPPDLSRLGAAAEQFGLVLLGPPPESGHPERGGNP